MPQSEISDGNELFFFHSSENWYQRVFTIRKFFSAVVLLTYLLNEKKVCSLCRRRGVQCKHKMKLKCERYFVPTASAAVWLLFRAIITVNKEISLYNVWIESPQLHDAAMSVEWIHLLICSYPNRSGMNENLIYWL